MVYRLLFFRVFSYVLHEDILWLINISNEFEVVDLPDVALVEVLSNE